MAGKLYVVGTPIGNLSDLSPRGAQTLSTADFVAAEDTRVTMKLLNHLGIKKPLVSYFEHNKLQRGEEICARILSGEQCALVTDAGMPAISDPGELLVAQAYERGIEVVCVPGPSAVVSALALSGLPTGRFTFEGFLSVSRKKRREHLAQIKTEKRTMIFYEAPHKLPATLQDLLETLGCRRISIVRELTKIHEEVIRTTLEEAANRYREETPRGEIVLVVEGAPEEEREEWAMEDAVEMARGLMDGGMSLSAAAKEASAATGIKKSEIYKELCDLRRDGE